jgi:Holliday junction resolvasome RuvABC endonuclease subunit
VIRAVGVDPGRHTGLVCLELVDWQILRARWIAHETVAPSTRGELGEAQRDGEMHERLAEVLARWQPTLVVLEEPLDAKPFWGGKRKAFRMPQTGTAFRLGAYYGLALAAARLAGAVLVSYPVQVSHKRLGWMGAATHDDVLVRMVALARHLAAPADLFDLEPDGSYRRDHCFMGLGVLAHHVEQMRRREEIRAATGGRRG